MTTHPIVSLLTFAVTDMPPPRRCLRCGATCEATCTGLNYTPGKSIPSAEHPITLQPTSWVWPRGWLEVRISEAGVYSSDDRHYYACPACSAEVRVALERIGFVIL